jgi:hypothetical protein
LCEHSLLLQVVLSSQKIIDKGLTYSELNPWLGQGLLLSSGKKRIMLFVSQLFNVYIHIVFTRGFVEIATEVADASFSFFNSE